MDYSSYYTASIIHKNEFIAAISSSSLFLTWLDILFGNFSRHITIQFLLRFFFSLLILSFSVQQLEYGIPLIVFRAIGLQFTSVKNLKSFSIKLLWEQSFLRCKRNLKLWHKLRRNGIWFPAPNFTDKWIYANWNKTKIKTT